MENRVDRMEIDGVDPYTNIRDEKCLEQIVNEVPFSSSRWRRSFEHYKKNKKTGQKADVLKLMRKIIIQRTIAACEQGWYVREDPELKVDLRALQEKQKMSSTMYRIIFTTTRRTLKLTRTRLLFVLKGNKKRTLIL